MSETDLTAILLDTRDQPERALDRLLPTVYDSLRRLAEDRLRRESPDHTLQATALVHEAYLKLVDQTRVEWRDRSHFFAVAAMAMRRILVDRARTRGRVRQGKGRERVPLEAAVDLAAAAETVDLVALDEALTRFASLHPREARLVELRYFAEFNLEEAATILEIAPRTAERWWAFSRAWLFRELSADDAARGGPHE